MILKLGCSSDLSEYLPKALVKGAYTLCVLMVMHALEEIKNDKFLFSASKKPKSSFHPNVEFVVTDWLK